MDSLKDALAQLHAVATTKNSTVEMMDEAVARVMVHHDPSTIKSMLSVLNDEAEFDEGMFSLIHAAESFDDTLYVQEFLSVLPALRESSPRWASIVLMRVLNNQVTKELMVRSLRDASPEIKDVVNWLCQKINERSPTFLSKTLPIMIASR